MKQNAKFLILLFCLSLQAQAKTSDSNETLNIQAGSVEIREKEGISIYKNQVHITRGSMIIEGELIQVHTINNEIKTIRIEGKPAKFRQLNDQDEEISAQSQQMEYQASDNKLILKKEAILVQGQNRFTSEHIIYDTRQDIVQAGDLSNTNSTSESERVTITIQPAKNKNNE
ncbi:MAG: lipopolysaccharide transport periplasmic protein LptA [Gammaproteobacteria bacterium]|nr:lipopolysaccharide transport periplasmic protein LptA [Gammaproteobacteria bacterium]MDH5734990.1 lipopolysaccharide transport periplasmic protein LptA [Gammaproteobacteria bacterium]